VRRVLESKDAELSRFVADCHTDMEQREKAIASERTAIAQTLSRQAAQAQTLDRWEARLRLEADRLTTRSAALDAKEQRISQLNGFFGAFDEANALNARANAVIAAGKGVDPAALHASPPPAIAHRNGGLPAAPSSGAAAAAVGGVRGMRA
jgi:hypothetical protein